MLSPTVETRYDTIRFPGHIRPPSHPEKLAVMARLHGVESAPAERCRVLELGCGDGGNLIAMAFGLPASEFVGIDLAESPIAAGQGMIAALGLKNVTLRVADLLELDPAELGAFDYIIAHGLYSWVPEPVREGLLRLCRDTLSPSGVVYLSYNVYPGRYLRQLVSEMAAYHLGPGLDAQALISGAREFTGFLAAAAREGSTPYHKALQEEAGDMAQAEEGSIFHDDLNEENTAFYFHEFAARAGRHGLQFLSEAELAAHPADRFSPPVCQVLESLSADIVRREQYLDFLTGKRFRRTLLCRSETPLRRGEETERLKALLIASPARATAEVKVTAPEPQTFQLAEGRALTTNQPLHKAALLHLAGLWPRSTTFQELHAASVRESRSTDSETITADNLAAMLLRAVGGGLVELHTHEPSFASEISERPQVSRLARQQLADGNLATTLRFTTHEFKEPLARKLVLLLDGTRNRTQLLAELLAEVQAQGLELRADGQTAGTLFETEAILRHHLDSALHYLARAPLLVE